jgi:curved DNA-binding protein CbpA
VLALLCLSSVSAFNPYSDEDDVGSGSVPSTSTLECTVDPATGEETCTSIAKVVMDDAELEARVAAAEAEREETARIKAEARAKYEAERYAEREQKKEQKRREAEKREKALNNQEDGKKKGPSQDDYKIKAPLKKLKVDYYKFFGVERDATKLAIRKNVNAMAVANHPDKCDTVDCREKMVVINQARDVLLNDETRAEYDFLLRFGFKIYDKELYEDMKKQYEEDPDNMPNGFPEDAIHPESDFSVMNVTAEGAGWILLFTGLITAGMLALPVYKFWVKSQSAEAKKAAQKKVLLEAQQRAKMEASSSSKKKAERYTGERSAKRFNENN